jgi:two-component system, chemotaxis family, chemotaxis protein CheY
MDTLKILCVDDSRMVQALIARALDSYDVSLILTSNGEEGYAALHGESPDLILLDYKMPLLSGIEFLERMRRELVFRDTPVIMITSERTPEMVANIVRAGVNDYIVKPFNEATLVDRITRQIRLYARPTKSQSGRILTESTPRSPVPVARKSEPPRSARDFQILEKRITRNDEGLEVESQHLATVADKMNEYILLFGTANSYYISIFLKLLEAGKVRVDFRDRSERMQLVRTSDAVTRAQAVALVDAHLAELHRAGDEAADLGVTQRISLDQFRPRIRLPKS